MKYWFYYLTEDEGVIRVGANRKPSMGTALLGKTWVVSEFDGRKWIMPCFPEITWGTLKKCEYIGKTSRIGISEDKP